MVSDRYPSARPAHPCSFTYPRSRYNDAWCVTPLTAGTLQSMRACSVEVVLQRRYTATEAPSFAQQPNRHALIVTRTTRSARTQARRITASPAPQASTVLGARFWAWHWLCRPPASGGRDQSPSPSLHTPAASHSHSHSPASGIRNGRGPRTARALQRIHRQVQRSTGEGRLGHASRHPIRAAPHGGRAPVRTTAHARQHRYVRSPVGRCSGTLSVRSVRPVILDRPPARRLVSGFYTPASWPWRHACAARDAQWRRGRHLQ